MAWIRSTGISHSGKGTQCYNANFCSDPLISLVIMVGKSDWDKQTMHCIVVILKKDLEKHYKKMAAKYYPLGGNNNPPLKQVFIASLPDELQPEIQRMMMTLRKEVATTTIGEIYQLALAALDKLCEQQQMFKQLNKNSGKLKGACSKSHLKIKCKESSMCECKPKKKTHWRSSTNTFHQKAFRRRRSKQNIVTSKGGNPYQVKQMLHLWKTMTLC
ncbi:polyprotein [Arachis hypogaea]|nr:polyprotein [Arachis hypogaea]